MRTLLYLLGIPLAAAGCVIAIFGDYVGVTFICYLGAIPGVLGAFLITIAGIGVD